jgi:hypothetical protein
MRPMDSYPDAWGAHKASVVGHRGPVLYTVVTEQSAPTLATGGDLLQAVEAGMKLIEFVVGGLTDSGTYRVETIPTTVSGVVAAPSQQPVAAATYRLRWVVVATGAEAAAVDLSAEIVRLLVIGAK